MTNVWLSPPEIVRAVGPFDLDPCAAPDPRPWPTARKHYTHDEGDGLARPWHGLVWLNPPYKPTPEPWTARLADHGAGVALLFARTDAPWFRRTIWELDALVMFLTSGHLYFYHADGSRGRFNGGAPSVLVGYGEVAARRLLGCELPGHFHWTRPTFLTLDGKPIGTWREALDAAMAGRELRLRDIYAAAEGTAKVREAKARGHNWQAQIRRALQVYFRPVAPAVWSAV
ncbi:MAG: DNA N-6-adenine-methyltransferase [Elusimicrobia bacterium]|nr:DNA N-6-adenine-methyltransferase [Elusimicrobiota bacterium]